MITVVNTRAIVGAPPGEVGDQVLFALLRTFSHIMGATPKTLRDRAREWCSASQVDRILAIPVATFAGGVEIEPLHRGQFGIGLALYKTVLFSRVPKINHLRPDEVADELDGHSLRCLLVYLFDLALSTEGHCCHIGRTAQLRNLVDPLLRMLGRFRRLEVWGADEFEVKAQAVREIMLRPDPLDHNREADLPLIAAMRELAEFYISIRRPFLNQVALLSI